jgi:hypothetical protein
MPFITLPEFEGKFYVPENDPACIKKNTCPDCFACQMCSDDRCAVCLASKDCRRKAELPLTDPSI